MLQKNISGLVIRLFDKTVILLLRLFGRMMLLMLLLLCHGSLLLLVLLQMMMLTALATVLTSHVSFSPYPNTFPKSPPPPPASSDPSDESPGY